MKLLRNTTLLKAITIVCIFSLLSSCGLSPSDEVAENEPLLFEYSDWWGDYTLIVAQEKGFFKDNHIDVQLVRYENLSKALPDLAAGLIDGGLFEVGDALNVSQHAEIKIVAAYDNGGSSTVVSVPEITTIQELKSKRIGVQIGSANELFVSEMLKTANLSTIDVTLVNVDPENVPASLGETIDAGFTYEPHTTEAVFSGNHLLFSNSESTTVFPDVIVFRSNIVKNRSDDIRAFLKAWFEAVEYRNQYPDDACQIIADYFQVSISEITPDDSVELMTLEDNREMFKAEADTNRSLFKTVRLNADFFIRMGVLSSQPIAANLLDSTYLP